MTENEIVIAFQNIIRNDKTNYQHHARRPWDGKIPAELEGESPGSIFLTPNEIARAALKQLGAPEPRRD